MFIFAIVYIIFILFIFLIVLCVAMNNQTSSLSNKLNMFFQKESFSNISKELTSTMNFISASNRGDNYLFAFKRTTYPYSLFDITSIYEKAQKDHIHNVILLTKATLQKNILDKLKEYDIQVWDNNKLDSLIFTTESTSILQTSDTSDDNCTIETNQVDAIQEPKSFLENFLEKPTRL